MAKNLIKIKPVKLSMKDIFLDYEKIPNKLFKVRTNENEKTKSKKN